MKISSSFCTSELHFVEFWQRPEPPDEQWSPLQQLQIKNSMYLPSKQGEGRSLQFHQQQVDPPHLEADLRPSVEKVWGVYS